MKLSQATSRECRCSYFAVSIVPEWGRKNYLLSLEKRVREIRPLSSS